MKFILIIAIFLGVINSTASAEELGNFQLVLDTLNDEQERARPSLREEDTFTFVSEGHYYSIRWYESIIMVTIKSEAHKSLIDTPFQHFRFNAEGELLRYCVPTQNARVHVYDDCTQKPNSAQIELARLGILQGYNLAKEKIAWHKACEVKYPNRALRKCRY